MFVNLTNKQKNNTDKEEKTPPELSKDPVNDDSQPEVGLNKSEEKKEVVQDPNIIQIDEIKDISEFLQEIVSKAVDERASDIHIEPREERIIVRFRIDGILREIYSLNKALESIILFKIKISGRLPTDEHFAPLDGRIAFIVNEKKVDTRISILPSTKGEKVVIRLLTSEGKSYSLEDLGITGKFLEVVKRSYSKPYGMILAVGPTGSGKTTTLYSILKILNTKEVNITTVEDPVEYDLEGVNHVQINNKADLTFANGLRAILRQDPNVIMIGEIRDSETAKIAINAAMTGHVVLSTLHTNDSVTTIPRLIDMGIEKFLVASTLNVIIAQRLARRLCDKCKTKSKLTPEEFQDLKEMRPDLAGLLKAEDEVYREKGCDECHGSGFRGRIGLYEILEVKENIRKLIGTSTSTDEIFHESRNNGLVLIVEDGVQKVKEGITSISELLRVTALKE